ncbi:hypothetical protein FRC10_008026 [Ceratobasidium sp. 414]|nr:hypothetical protein FRC10_008026 [Ceratobasidium sp. 414]
MGGFILTRSHGRLTLRSQGSPVYERLHIVTVSFVSMDRLGIKSKDHSTFSSNNTVVQQQTRDSNLPTQVCTESNLKTTENQLKAADVIIRNPSTISSAPKVTKAIINTLLAPAKSLAELLHSVSDAVPQTEPVAELFRALLRLELDRQDNDKHIAALYHSMAGMLLVLAKLDSVFLRESELIEILDQRLDEIVKLLNEFGNFCDVYYKHRAVARFLRISKYSEMIEDFAQSFADMKRDLDALVSHRATLTVLQTSDVVNSIASDVSQLLKFMNTQTTRERETRDFIKSKGGVDAILKDNKLLDEVAAKLGDNVNKSLQASRSLQYTLHAELEVQLKENQTLFALKLQCVQDQIEEAVKRSTTTILMKLDSGPHEVINDPDIKTIWKGLYMRHFQFSRANSNLTCSYRYAKSRHFVSAVHHHFEQVFTQYTIDNNGARHPDTWTLNYLSRVIFYPAIGDAIDEDSSGFVSLHELNRFFDPRPQGWSTPQWLAYFIEYRLKQLIRYRDKIMQRLGVFEYSIDGLHPENKEPLGEYVAGIKDGIKLIAESLYGDVLDYFEDDSNEALEMDALRDKYTEYLTGLVEQQLGKSKHELDDKRTLSIVIGSNTRLESRILCVMHRLLKWHHKIFDIGKDKPLQDGVTIAMINSFQVIFDAFTTRTRSLMECWRQQRMDVELQAQWYANGLFEDCYEREKAQPDDYDYDDEELTDDEEDMNEEEENELVEHATRPPTAAETEAGSAVEKGDQEAQEGEEDDEGEESQDEGEGEGDEEDACEEDEEDGSAGGANSQSFESSLLAILRLLQGRNRKRPTSAKWMRDCNDWRRTWEN